MAIFAVYAKPLAYADFNDSHDKFQLIEVFRVCGLRS